VTLAALFAASCVRTALCAPVSEQGADVEQVEPEPDGDA
jgi:hypothetical protein